MNNNFIPAGIIVDGDGDFASLKKRFFPHYRIVKTDGPRGHSVDAITLANQTRKQAKILKAFNCKKIIVIADFEKRSENYTDFLQSLKEAFKQIDIGIDINIVVPNRMIENWYLADIEYLSKIKQFLRKNIKQKNYEGKHGKNEIKRHMVKGTTYSETKHGPQMFESIRFDIAQQNSASLCELLDLLML
jgi:hypothetical protein